MRPEAIELANTFINDFYAADQQIAWGELEQERKLWLSDNTILIGRVDAQGVTGDGERFFAEWKTIGTNGARDMDFVKLKWRMDPQALTYGVLLGDEVKRFTVRWAVKSKPPTTDFEWYTYTTAEVEWWRVELLEVAERIRSLRKRGQWAQVGATVPTNWPVDLDACYKYGKKYPCPFIAGCHSLRFSLVPEGMNERIPHLAVEQKLLATEEVSIDGVSTIGDNRDIVILDASRVEVWMQCQEKYRRLYEHYRAGEGLSEQSEAIEIGKDFHTLISEHLTRLSKGQRQDG